MAKAVFTSKPTFGFFAGILLVIAVGSLFWRQHPQDQDAVADAIMYGLIAGAALMEAALFSLGCAWGGVQRIPNPLWAVCAGVMTGAGFAAYSALMSDIPAPVDLETRKQHGIYGLLGTAYAMLAPVFAGLLCAWLSKLRTRIA